ncbi:MAG: 4Fe-4S binding protein [Atribacterota bacterium]|jgi:formate hydrogenlyase subunit 6/NADH:ubiquinone oxidoreductase subunit I|nr:4Fe-4S binding protein [Atribacterota bacterium]MDD4895289.1 4Fe-4S binding protein [Atribacterota bacterium]MDD5636613.1 4Fe-4S binding protein [Atribacterota bacterium]
MPTPIVFELIKQLFHRPATNCFPVKYYPSQTTVTDLIKKVQDGQVKINSPVTVPEKFRGKIVYDREKCIGCRLCVRVCPSRAIEFLPEEKKIKIRIDRCIFCAQCNDVCPVNCLSMSENFLLANEDRFDSEMIVQ